VKYSFRCGQTPVRVREGALSRTQEEHGAVVHAVCAVQLVEGAQQTDGGAGMSASASRGKVLQGLKSNQMGARNGVTLKDFA
jgi:hypothetical protein